MTIRDSLSPDFGGLGKKIEQPKPEPKRYEVAPGIVQNKDGKLETNLPIPTAPMIPVPDVVVLDPSDWVSIICDED